MNVFGALCGFIAKSESSDRYIDEHSKIIMLERSLKNKTTSWNVSHEEKHNLKRKKIYGYGQSDR